MRVVVALGGNALQQRGQPMTVANQRENVRIACRALAPIARQHELVISHGNGPQVGLLALQAASYDDVSTYPFDVLGAQTEGMIGYLIEQELGNFLPFEQSIATVLTMVEVDSNDPAFANPTKFVGPSYSQGVAKQLAAERGWQVAQDGDKWRRVVPSPTPQRIFEIKAIETLLAADTVVVCTGGGGIPTMYRRSREDTSGRRLVGVDAVIDKDRSSAVLAQSLGAQLLIIATDEPAVYVDWGTPQQRAIRSISPDDILEYDFPAGSMGPKVEAAAQFATSGPGRTAVIGSLADIADIVAGNKGTHVRKDVAEPVFD